MKTLFLLLSLMPFAAMAQTSDTAGIRQCIQSLFDGMRKGDSTMVRSAFHPSATLHSVLKNRAGEVTLREESVNAFIKVAGTPHQEVWNEIIWSYDIKIDGDMSTVWTPYTFYLGDTLSHCGVNAFTLIRTAKGWRIASITDTRRKEACKPK